MSDVTTPRIELTLWFDRWQKVRDVIEGSEAVKNAGARYLPVLNPTDISAENIARNQQYIFRAYWFGATSRTLEGMIGIAFNKEPQIEIPSSMDILLTDVDGAG
ncbi:unnamed protein product, partial [marine sediment metagenome]